MRNFALIAVLAFFALLGFSSCKKDYKCTCNIAVPLAQFDTTFVIEIEEAKKKEAKYRCRGAEDAYKPFFGGFFGSVTCDLD